MNEVQLQIQNEMHLKNIDLHTSLKTQEKERSVLTKLS